MKKRKVLGAVLKMAPRILATFTFYIWKYARHPEKYPIEVRYNRIRRLIIKIIDTLHVDQKVEGIENLRKLEAKDQRYLAVSNHLDVIDPLMFIYHSEKPLTFVGKKEILKIPFVRTIIKALDGMFLDRNDLRDGIRVIKNTERLIKENICSVVIFPEGTRNKNPDGDLPEFHGGTFKPAFRIGCPVLPIASFGSQNIIGESYKRTPYDIAFLPIEYASENDDGNSISFSEKIHDLIASKMYEQRDDIHKFIEEGKNKIPMRKGKVR